MRSQWLVLAVPLVVYGWIETSRLVKETFKTSKPDRNKNLESLLVLDG